MELLRTIGRGGRLKLSGYARARGAELLREALAARRAGEPALRDCFIAKRSVRDVISPVEGVRGLHRYAIVPLEELRNPMRRATLLFGIVCPGVTPDARNRTPQQQYYQALVDGAQLEAKAIRDLDDGTAKVTPTFAVLHAAEAARNIANERALRGEARAALAAALRQQLPPGR